MTPELKTACEIVFQEHKASSQPIKWSSETFRGRISLGLADLAKDTLVKKNIIILSDKSRKISTLLNPAVATASGFEEAEEMIKNKKQVMVTSIEDNRPAYIARKVSGFDTTAAKYSHHLLSIAGEPETKLAEIKWYMKPVFYYFVWPLCAAAGGVLISFLIDFAYTELFLHIK